jgi:acetyltransferase-like isoleucine patch superfamily enzyme
MRLYLYLLVCFGLRLTGTPRYISSRTRFDDIDKVQMGERVVISEHVTLLTHDYSLTTALIAIGKCPPTDVAVLRPITIGHNVFIGLRSVILPGTKIGDNVIIGAGSIVRGTVAAGTIVAGSPAKAIGSVAERAVVWQQSLDDAILSVD